MSATEPTAPTISIHPETRMGATRLTVSDLGRSRAFYEQAVGLHASELEDGGVALGAEPSEPLVELYGDPTAPALNRRATGLFHLAILLPSRRDLALALVRLAQARWPLDGASDHLVSEALYLSDPDGNGIEIYRDRPRSDWPQAGGRLEMATLPLDLDDVLGELSSEDGFQALAPAGTTMGHVHLQVADLADSEAFYSGVLGFDVMVRVYPGALFVSAGGYHHHIGMNIWNSRGAGPPSRGSVGLRSFEAVVPSIEELERVLARADAAGIAVENTDTGALMRDPSGNGVILRAA